MCSQKREVSINTHPFSSGKGRGIFSGLQNGFSLAETFPVSNAPLGTQMSTMVDEIRVLLSWKIEEKED